MRRTHGVTIVVVVSLLVCANVFAGGFLKYDGVDGESKDSAHQKWNDLLAWSWGTGTPKQVGRGGCGNVDRQYLVVTKYVDSTTPEFVRLAESCASADEVILEVPILPDGVGGTQRFLRIRMEDVRVRKIEMGSSSGDEIPTENLSLDFRSVEIEVVPSRRD